MSKSIPPQQIQLNNAKVPTPKRIQLLQLQIASTHDKQYKNNTSGLLDKVDLVFEAFAKMHDQNFTDNRKGTAPVYTLPEFFWSDFKSNLTQDQKEMLMAAIQEKAASPKFEGAIFVLGTMCTAQPPESLTALRPQDLHMLQDQLGSDECDLSAAYQEAMGPEVENCEQYRNEPRALLATVGDMLNARLDALNIPRDTPPERLGEFNFNREQELATIVETVKKMATHRDALKTLAFMPKGSYLSSSKIETFRQKVAKKDWPGARKLLKKGLAPSFKQKDLDNLISKDLRAINDFFQTFGSSKSNFSKLANTFRKFYYPNSATMPEREVYEERVSRQEAKAQSILRMRSPGDMYKLTENQSMVIEGGKGGKMETVTKLFPSKADTPSYFSNRLSNLLIPEKLQSSSIKANPEQNSSDLGDQINEAGITADDFVFDSPKTGVKLGVVICSDYTNQVYKAFFDEDNKDRIDHLQIVAAGVPSLKTDIGSSKTSIGLNDGADGSSQFIRSDSEINNKRDISTDVVEYNPQTQEFTIFSQSQEFTKKPLDLENKSYAVGVSQPIHLSDGDESSIGSFDENTNKGTINLMEKLIIDSETSISLWQEQLAEVDGLLERMKEPMSVIEPREELIDKDNFQKQKFLKQNEQGIWESKVDHEKLTQEMVKPRELMADIIGVVNQDVFLLSGNNNQPFKPNERLEVRTRLQELKHTLEANIDDSFKVIEHNKKMLDRIDVDRIRAKIHQNDFV
ncbi:hypothetical protein [Acanthopleuribacter pedis]|uniref:Uncharacterized protein n=1 Tax=Acanthopleuribacter pedis TaxID=442870 RepID=A0A8J7U5N0_9BACT|nr:hypothetical protein [Acanthopleuribacter pedis]MBO1319491.1 hypothetical protein [Acanthopleuribacter pedis]